MEERSECSHVTSGKKEKGDQMFYNYNSESEAVWL